MSSSALTFESSYIDDHLVSELSDYTNKLRSSRDDSHYEMRESSLRLPYDFESMQNHIIDVNDSIGASGIEYCIVVGIGGSNNGTRAVYEALSAYQKPDAEIVFVDTVSPLVIDKAIAAIKAADSSSEIVINVVSKSGTTTETISNFEVIYQKMNKRFDSPEERIVATTSYASPLWYAADKRGMHTLAIPDNVGGRYSVLSPVGLFPLSVAGFDIADIVSGARDMIDESLDSETRNRPAESAAALESARRDGVIADNSFIFNPELKAVGGWYRQLVGESLGKEHNNEGDVVNAGILPIVSMGTTDLHSVGQLFFGGPRNIFTTFIRAPYPDVYRVPADTELELLDGISEKSISDIMAATYKGVIESYENTDLPYAQIMLPAIDEYAIGQLLQFKMLQVMYQGELMNINAFNQPNVEGYKDATRKILTAN